MQEAKAWEFLELVQGGMTVIEYAMKFLQLLCFGMYLIPKEEKKANKFERCIWIMMSYFDIQDFSQLVDQASIYKERQLSMHIRREWKWGVFHLRGHKDVPLLTLQFHNKRIRYRSCVGSVAGFIGDPTRRQPGLSTGIANSATSARIVWARELLRNLWH
jgi:hypothetical protein